MIGGRRSRRDREASAQSVRVAERASAGIDGARASARMIRTHRLSEGILIEASIMARLLRLRLLTLDASILLLPAGPPPAGDESGTLERERLPRRAATGARLSDAIRSIDEAELELARARHANAGEAPPGRTPRRAAISRT